MDDPDTSETGRGAAPEKKRSKKTRILCAALVVLLVGGLAALGWLYYDAARTVRSQKVSINNLQKRLKDLGVVVGPVDVADADEAAAACSGGSAYTADVGNFGLTLSNPNVIVRNLDANFEGGPITDLTIGRCIASETNVVDAYPTYKVNILGHPASNSATLRANFEAQWGSPLTPDAPLTIDGVAAQTYTGSGLFTTKLVYFDHGGIGYQIELPDVNPTSEAMLSDALSDWSFTP